jgi:heat shock protein HtpX
MTLAASGLTTQIYNNRLRSMALLAGFPLLLILMTAAFFGFTDAAQQAAYNPVDWSHALAAARAGAVQYGPYAFLAALGWFAFAYIFHADLLRMATHAVPVTRAEMPKIYNMLENLCISRGIPMPAFEIVETDALNAFASGIDQKSYRITLTRGIVNALKDDELESVIGHELTHILNRDARLMVIAVVFAGMISFFAQLAFRMLVQGGRRSAYYSGGRDERRGGSGGLMLLIAFAILAVGWVFAIGIRFALSRRREYLADEGSVMLTKNPEAMMRALMRISGQDHVPGMPRDIQRMCIENSENAFSLFMATHPPIKDRIETLSRLTHTPIPTPDEAPPAPPPGPWGA